MNDINEFVESLQEEEKEQYEEKLQELKDIMNDAKKAVTGLGAGMGTAGVLGIGGLSLCLKTEGKYEKYKKEEEAEKE